MNYLNDMPASCPTTHTRSRLALHDRKAEFLDTLAILLGCKEKLNEFPDGRQPDVLRFDSRNNILFIGEAKHTESPGCRATQARLQRYFSWLCLHVKARNGTGIFAVCFGRESDAQGWEETISLLAQEVSLCISEQEIEYFEPGLTVFWCIFRESSLMYPT